MVVECLTKKQRKEITFYIREQTWNHIYDNMLTENQRKDRDSMKVIALEMEEIFNSVAATFGLVST